MDSSILSPGPRKTTLTMKEQIKCAYLHFVREIDQQDLAIAFEVNIGRVNEACTTIARAISSDAAVARDLAAK